MRFDYCSGDGQSETCASDSATAGLVSAVEAVEDVGQVCGVDADSVVGDGDFQFVVVVGGCAEDDGAAGFGGMYGVAQDVAEGLAHSGAIEVPIGQVIGKVIGYWGQQCDLVFRCLWSPAVDLSGEELAD